MITKELANELRRQLESDLLEFGWILQVSRDIEGVGKNPNAEIVHAAIVELLNDGSAEVGDARNVAGRVEFYSWPGSLEEISVRLKRVIAETGLTPESGEGFWLAKV